VNKQIIIRKRILKKALLHLAGHMIQGSLVKLNHRCGNKNCHCAKPKDPGHTGYYLSVPTPEKTQMHYLPKDLLPQLPQPLAAFKQYWEIGKRISQINLALLKESAQRRKSHVH